MKNFCTEAAMGVSVNAQENENSDYVRSVKTMCSIITERNFSPIHPKLFPFTWNYFRERRAVKVLHDHTDGVIDKKINELKKDSKNINGVSVEQRPAFLDLLINSTIDDKPLSRLDIREEVDTFMFEVREFFINTEKIVLIVNKGLFAVVFWHD